MNTSLTMFLTIVLSSVAFADEVPNLLVTPGSVRSELTKEQICTIQWGKDVRHVTESMKKDVFQLYAYSGNDDARCVGTGSRRCEIDHLISRELGGADEVSNLWPQAYGTTPWNAVMKDRLENRLHKEMCAGTITLEQSRDSLVNDWREAYKAYYGTP